MKRARLALFALALASCGGERVHDPLQVKLPGERGVSSLARGPDRTVWFTRYGQGRAGYFREASPAAVEEIRFDDPACLANEIAAGPGGRVWIGTWSDSRILSVDPRPPHTVVEIDTRIPGRPSQLAEGPDGRIWFTQGGRSLGRIDPNRPNLAENLRQEADLDLRGIAVSGGTMWVASFLADTLAIVVDGQVHPYLKGRGCKPILAASSPDGAAWFGCRGAPLAIRVSAAQDVRVVSRPPMSSSIVAMGADASGALWILRAKSGSLSRILPDGSVEDVLPLPADMKAPSSLVFDHDGNLWVGDAEAPRLVRLLTREAISRRGPGR